VADEWQTILGSVGGGVERVQHDNGGTSRQHEPNFSLPVCECSGEFCGPEMTALNKDWNITVVRGRPYHPQSQGKCEQVHRFVKRKLRAYLKAHPGATWPEALAKVAGNRCSHIVLL
jgi:hypothetical protein